MSARSLPPSDMLTGERPRRSTSLKLGASLAFIVSVALVPPRHGPWLLCALPVLLGIAHRSGLLHRAFLRRLAVSLPFILGLAVLALFQPEGWRHGLALVAKASTSVLALQILASTTRLSDSLRTLRGPLMPPILADTILLLYRYLFLISDESKRMRRARAGRTLRASRWALWRALGSSIGLLFVRAVQRAERVQAAMRARGGS